MRKNTQRHTSKIKGIENGNFHIFFEDKYRKKKFADYRVGENEWWLHMIDQWL